MSYIMLIFLIWNCSFATGFFIKTHFPASNTSHFPRLRMMASVPSLQEFTVCSFLNYYDSNNKVLTFISYASSKSVDQIWISLVKDSLCWNVDFNIGTPYKRFKCNSEWISGKWYHLCATWFSPTATAKIYQNGNICEYVDSNKPYEKTAIPAGGVLIIGQDQDAVDSRYNASQAWYGDIADVQIWDEALNIDQIREAGKCNGKRKAGNVFSWMKTEMIAIGNVVFSETQLCYP